MKKRKYIPNKARAVENARIVTMHRGKRIVKEYKSGEPLVGTPLDNDDAPPFTGYVRGWFQGGTQ